MIVFIDDEPDFITPFVDALTYRGFKVNVIDNVDDAWVYLQSNKDAVDAVILDIMMPPGILFSSDDTKDGLRTGVNFMMLMKKLDARIPIICLTNADLRRFEKSDHPNSFFYEKKDMDPWKLVDKMDDVKRRKLT